MATRRPTVLRGWICATLLLTCSQVALAQDDPAPSEYQHVVADALAEFREGRYLEARALFVRAHALRPSARTWRGMGQAAFGAKRYAQSIFDLSQALDSVVNRLSPKLRKQTLDLVTQARGHTGRFRLKLDAQDASLMVDGSDPIYDRDGALLLDEGSRRVMVRADGLERETVVPVTGGEASDLDLSVSLSPAPPEHGTLEELNSAQPANNQPALEVELPPPPPGPTRAEVAHAPKGFPWLAAGAFGVAGIAGGLGIWQETIRADRASRWQRQCTNGSPDASTCNWFRAGQSRATTLEAVSLAFAGAFLVTGVVLLVVHESETESETPAEVAVACGPAGMGLACRLQL